MPLERQEAILAQHLGMGFLPDLKRYWADMPPPFE
jgi:hypothetical protein